MMGNSPDLFTATSGQDLILRDYQKRAINAGLWYFRDERSDYGALMVLPTGCHAKGTEVLMTDTTVRPIESITVGEFVMGPDGRPRKVLSLCRGKGEMYRITPRHGGKPFIVNGDHILSLISTSEGKKAVCPSHQRGGEHQCISVNDYLKKSKSWKHLRKLHYSNELPYGNSDHLLIPPWLLGIILGDGCVRNGGVTITTPDEEIISNVRQFVDEHSLDLRISGKPNNKACDLHIIKKYNRRDSTYKNPLLQALRELDIAEKGSADKFIPDTYKKASVGARLEILAGLLDSDGSHDDWGGYDFISKSKYLSGDLAFIARSLGISVCESIAYKEAQTGAGGYYHRLHLSGDTEKIPCRVKRKQASPRRQKKNALVTSFSIEPTGRDDYYGFTLDGDHLYLTSDFLVHHNSGKSLIVAGIARELDEPTLIFQPTKEILEQNYAKMQAYDKHAKIYSASMSRKEIGHLTFATIGSAKNNLELFRHFKNIIIDECHYVNAKKGMYQEFLGAIGNKVIGLTATPYRLVTDGFGGSILKFLTRTRPRIFHRVIHVTQNGDLFKRGYLAKLKYLSTDGFDSQQLQLNSTGADYTDSSVKRYYKSINFVEILRNNVMMCLNGNRKSILVFTRFIQESRALIDGLGGCGEIVTGETPKKEREDIIRRFRSGQTRVVSNVGVLTVGFDFPELDAIIIGRPTMSLALYYQMIGRGIRIHPDKEQTIVIDLCDNFRKFGPVEDLQLVAPKPGCWIISSNGRQLTNIYYGDRSFRHARN